MARHYIPTVLPSLRSRCSTFQDGVAGAFPPVARTFEDAAVSGFMRPVRFEGEINNLEVVGEIPKEINGTFYRVMPEPQFPAFIPNDPVSRHFCSSSPWLTSRGTVVQWR